MGRPLVFAVTGLALSLAAADFWEKKPSAEWSDKEVNRGWTNSPWAKEVSATFQVQDCRRAAAGLVAQGDGGIAQQAATAGALER